LPKCQWAARFVSPQLLSRSRSFPSLFVNSLVHSPLFISPSPFCFEVSNEATDGKTPADYILDLISLPSFLTDPLACPFFSVLLTDSSLLLSTSVSRRLFTDERFWPELKAENDFS